MRPAPRSRFLASAGAGVLLLGAVTAALPSHAQAPDGAPPLQLRSAAQLSPPASDSPGPTVVTGERIRSQVDVRTVVEGQAELQQDDASIRADRLELEMARQLLTTEGPVEVSHQGDRFVGTELQLRLDTFEGFFSQPQYELRTGANGRAARIDFLGEKRLVAHQASYTSCERDNEASWRPAWELSAERFEFDLEAEVGSAYKPVLRFQDVPILAWGGRLSFPLSDKRKSGFLPPSYALDTISGLSLSVPYYLDIAPHRDATFTPTTMSKRGVDLGAELRYLQPNDQGTLRANWLPDDQLTGGQRWSWGLLHSGRLAEPVAGGGLGYSLNLNRVSDDDYWRDFPRAQNQVLTQRLLPVDAALSWARGPLSLGFRALSWQTLQSADSVITPPYDRLPQLTARYGLSDVPVAGLGGMDWAVDGDFTRFEALRRLTGQANADRLVLRAQLSRPWVSAAGYLTPRLQLHATHYSFMEEVAGRRAASRLVPTVSVDSGLQFERPAQFFGRGFVQTLEPRAFYVYTPYRDQRHLPNYDSAESSFSFASLFTENTFLGNDRIADANLLTLGLTSRLLDERTGAEGMRVGLAQRVRLSDQQVTLGGGPPPVDAERLSDLLLSGSFNWTRQWALSLHTQYNPKLDRSLRSAVSARYSPSAYRVVSAAYRRQQPLTPGDAGSQQLDVGWQWPINDLWGDRGRDLGPGQGQGGRRWYSVGRLNYSMLDGQLVDSVIGVEYDGCCWIGRLVLQRSTLGQNAANTQIMLQLEFVGFSRIGNNPLSTLRANVPGYQMLREQVSAPSRSTPYE